MSAGIVSTEAILRGTGELEHVVIRDRRGRVIPPGARCGTDRGYMDHRRRRDLACQSCCDAHAEAERARKAMRRAEHDDNYRCPCHSCRMGS